MSMDMEDTHVATEELLRWIDGELPDESARATAAHVDACAECRARVDVLREVSTTLAEAAREIPVPASLAEAPRLAMRAHTRRATPRRRMLVGAGLFAACALALVAQPLRQRLARAFGDERQVDARAAVSAPSAAAAPEARETVLGVAPRSATFAVEVASARPGDSIHVIAGAGREVTVHVPAGAAVWSMPDGVRLAHERGGAVGYRLEVGAGVQSVRVRRGDGTVVVVERSALAARGDTSIAAGGR